MASSSSSVSRASDDWPALSLSATECAEKAQALASAFRSARPDFQKYFVYYHKNPESDEFQRFYLQAKGQLHQLSQEAVRITQTAQRQTQALARADQATQKKLQWERQRRARLGKTRRQLEQTYQGTEQSVDDVAAQYQRQYLYNLELLAGAAGLLGLLVLG